MCGDLWRSQATTHILLGNTVGAKIPLGRISSFFVRYNNRHLFRIYEIYTRGFFYVYRADSRAARVGAATR
ncbi:hypothetical protein KSB_78620 [Ktedonobacter robiniae]|uniref:Uncharacterized protein n=1 Tax=Ktedonobacter robiniae TaxID=2778365 RepID=A0ABQ3V3P3_9CHLR|nr:hypothetical protein KSB_78620 [Ktedonobacter robiniae]